MSKNMVNPGANDGLNSDAEELYLQELWELRESKEKGDIDNFNRQFQEWCDAEEAKENAREKGWS